MTFYATVKHHSAVGYWEKIEAKDITAAKRMATKEYGNGYHGHVIHLVEADNVSQELIDMGYLNDLPAYTKAIGGNGWNDPL